MCSFAKLPVEVQASLIESGLAPWEMGLEPEDVKLPDAAVQRFAILSSLRSDTTRLIRTMNRYMKFHVKEAVPCQA